MSSNDSASQGELSRTLLAFADRHNQTARPFNWKFTVSDLAETLRRISEYEQPVQQQAILTRPHDSTRRIYEVTHLGCRAVFTRILGVKRRKAVGPAWLRPR